MPWYEYECPKCGPFEVHQRMTEAPLSTHSCGEPVERKISQVSFALKGGGWYADGYASKKASSSEGSSPMCSPAGCANQSCPMKAAEA